ncbi:hypothetical protein PanWU01x14_112390 [Parasponia andersonii]|uniref:Uncharacterized protein n=1 Tax=Parasponia andersonii TaxID=3476 RepID=A0A2P5CY84_PARAD|nr:hypothetical protein PanWU01x14_112390 [Parasponia andersonii]
MKIFGWMHSKLKHGTQDENSKKPNSKPVKQTFMQESSKEEVNDWLHELLAIGTFGKNDLKEDLERINDLQDNKLSSSEAHLRDPTSEKVGNRQDELNSLLMHKQDDESALTTELEPASHLERFLSRELSLEHERVESNNAHSNESNTKLVLSRGGKDVSMDNTKNAIGKKSFSFLLKKMFVCRSGFPPPPSPRAPIPEPRMEKIFRAILNKKIYPQSSNPSSSIKMYKENRHMQNPNKDNDNDQNADNGSKWVKTDSDCEFL